MSTTFVSLRNNRICIQRYSRYFMYNLKYVVELLFKEKKLEREQIKDTADMIDKFVISPIKKTHDFREQKKRAKAIFNLKYSKNDNF